jgi:hypothetical protein
MLADEGRRHRPRGHRGLAPDQEAVLALQRTAGNEAVRQALAAQPAGHVRSVDALTIEREGMPPADGVEQIRSHTENKVTFALTVRTIRDEPPIMRPAPAEKTKDGYVVRAQKVDSIPEPDIHEYWPKDGVHKLSEGSYVDVTPDWERTLEKGEDRHRDDAKLAWELTWKKVQNTINELAKKDPPAEATQKEAEEALWKRYVAALPKDLQPEGDKPSIAKQRDVLQVEPGNFMAWMWEATVARDQRDNHSTRVGASPPDARPAPEKDAFVGGVEPHPKFLVPGPTAEEFIPEIRKNYQPGKIIKGSKLKSGESNTKH